MASSGQRDAEAGLPVEPVSKFIPSFRDVRVYVGGSDQRPLTVPATEPVRGGAASSAFWIDPAEELTVSFFTQLIPSSRHALRSQLRQLVYQALAG